MTQVAEIYQRLLNAKIGDCEISEDIEKFFKEYIQRRLNEGWNSDEVFAFLRVSEEFNTDINEERALGIMARIEMNVKKRILSARANA